MADTNTSTTVSSAPNVGNENDPKSTPAEYSRTVDLSRHTTQHVVGNVTTVDQETQTDDKLTGEFDNRVMELFNGAIQEREARENVRANKRNFNRMLTMVGALVIGLVVTYVLTSGALGPATKVLAPYAFVITILMDAGITAYAWIKHY
jgi:hypothetical protein